jgi:hypothetical protein
MRGATVIPVRHLRHSGPTMALEAGVNPVQVAFRLGHTSTRMIEQHDAGRLDRADRDISRALDDAARMRHAEGRKVLRALQTAVDLRFL